MASRSLWIMTGVSCGKWKVSIDLLTVMYYLNAGERGSVFIEENYETNFICIITVGYAACFRLC